MRVTIIGGVFGIAASTRSRNGRQSVPKQDLYLGLLIGRREDSEPEMPGDAQFSQSCHQNVAVHCTAKIATGDGGHVIVALVDHHREVPGQQVFERAIDQGIAEHDLVGLFRIDLGGYLQRGVVEIDARADTIEPEGYPAQGFARTLVDAGGMTVFSVAQRGHGRANEPDSDQGRGHCHTPPC